MATVFKPEERRLIELWERHMRYEFTDRDPRHDRRPRTR
jgi:hypothetical protein